MYLRTPKRYRTPRRRLRLFSGRTVLFLVLIPLLGWVGYQIWMHRDTVYDNVTPRINEVAETLQTQIAPEPTSSPTPNMASLQSACSSAEQSGNLEDAIVECTELAESSPNDVELYYKVAHLLVITSNLGADTQRLQQALAFAERTINAAPEKPHGWAIRAMAYDWMGEYELALASALHAWSLDADYGPTYSFLGEIYHDLGRNDLANDYLEQSLDLDTASVAVAHTFRNQGLILSNQGYYADAIQPYQAALQNAPGYTYIAIELANNYIALGELEKAIQVLTSVLDRNPRDPAVLFSLGWAHARNGNSDRSFEYYNRCLDADPSNIDCLSFLGGWYYNEGDLNSAVDNLERAIALGSDNEDDYLELGLSLAALGFCEDAIPYLRMGYQIAVEAENYDKQARFINQLQSCDVTVVPVETQ